MTPGFCFTVCGVWMNGFVSNDYQGHNAHTGLTTRKMEGKRRVANYDLTARDIMQVEIAAILGDATIVDAAAQMRYEGVRSLLIVPRSPSDPYAIITFSDIVNKVLSHGHDPAKMQVHEVMTKPLITVPPDMRVEYIARLFQQSRTA